MNNEIKLLIVDDSAVVRQAIEVLLRRINSVHGSEYAVHCTKENKPKNELIEHRTSGHYE